MLRGPTHPSDTEPSQPPTPGPKPSIPMASTSNHYRFQPTSAPIPPHVSPAAVPASLALLPLSHQHTLVQRSYLSPAFQIPTSRLSLISVDYRSQQTSYTATTSTTTLTGLCATDIPYSGVFSLVAYDDTTAFVAPSTTSSFGINPYQCCVSCQNVIEGSCLGYFAVPGVSCVLLEAYLDPNDPCSLGGLFSTSSVYPNNLGGTGPCASTIVVN